MYCTMHHTLRFGQIRPFIESEDGATIDAQHISLGGGASTGAGGGDEPALEGSD
jgi:hypothetical protein